jgi:NADH:ubiquinone oxidoreductase subunit 3 (subunit A)
MPILDQIKKIEKENKRWRRKTLKLNLLFIVMDLFTLLAYPIVFVHNKLRQFSKSKASVAVPDLLATLPTIVGR